MTAKRWASSISTNSVVLFVCFGLILNCYIITRLHIFEYKYGPKRVQRWESIALVRNQINCFISLRDQFSQAKFTNASFFVPFCARRECLPCFVCRVINNLLHEKSCNTAVFLLVSFIFSRLKQARKNKTDS